MKSFLKGWPVKIAKFALAGGLIAFMIKQGHFDLEAFKDLLRPSLIFWGLALVGCNIWLLNWRWYLLLRARSFPCQLRDTVPLYLIGMFFNYALPGAIGGDVVKGYYVAQDNPQRKMDAVLSVVVDRVFGLYSMVLLALIAILLNLQFVWTHEKLYWVAISTMGVFALLTLFLATAFSRRLNQTLHVVRWLNKLRLGHGLVRAYEAFHTYGVNRGVILLSLVISMAAQTLSVLFFYMIGQALGEYDIPWSTYLFAVPLGFVVTAIPIAPAGIGVGQMAFLILFQLSSGKESLIGQTAVTFFQVTVFLWSMSGAYFYLRRKKPAALIMQE